MSMEVRNYFASKERSKFKIAAAFVINTLAHKIMANFVLCVHRPRHKTSVFTTEGKAMECIMKMKEQYYTERKL